MNKYLVKIANAIRLHRLVPASGHSNKEEKLIEVAGSIKDTYDHYKNYKNKNKTDAKRKSSRSKLRFHES